MLSTLTDEVRGCEGKEKKEWKQTPNEVVRKAIWSTDLQLPEQTQKYSLPTIERFGNFWWRNFTGRRHEGLTAVPEGGILF